MQEASLLKWQTLRRYWVGIKTSVKILVTVFESLQYCMWQVGACLQHTVRCLHLWNVLVIVLWLAWRADLPKGEAFLLLADTATIFLAQEVSIWGYKLLSSLIPPSRILRTERLVRLANTASKPDLSCRGETLWRGSWGKQQICSVEQPKHYRLYLGYVQ